MSKVKEIIHVQLDELHNDIFAHYEKGILYINENYNGGNNLSTIFVE